METCKFCNQDNHRAPANSEYVCGDCVNDIISIPIEDRRDEIKRLRAIGDTEKVEAYEMVMGKQA